MDHLVPSSKDNLSETSVANPSNCAEAQEPSKLVSNRTYVMYHGTSSRNAESIQAWGFRPSSEGQLGAGVYLSRDLQNARRYPIGHPLSDKVVIQVRVNVGKVVFINALNQSLRKTWHDFGYDTAWVMPNSGFMSSALEQNCVWDPRRISILGTIQPTTAHSHRGPCTCKRFKMGRKCTLKRGCRLVRKCIH